MPREPLGEEEEGRCSGVVKNPRELQDFKGWRGMEAKLA
jgi:hypothetical protein